MTVELNHTIIPARDKQVSAAFLADILGLELGPRVARFVSLPLANGVTLDYMDIADGPPRGIVTDEQAFSPGHYAFLVSEDVFDAAMERIKAARVAFHAEPGGSRPGEIYHSSGARGVYFPDPDGHLMELLTADLSGRTAEPNDLEGPGA